MPVNETVTHLVLRLIEGDGTAFNPLHDLLMDEADPRLTDLNEWLYDLRYRNIHHLTIFDPREAFLERLKRIFARELIEHEGLNAQQIIANAFEKTEPPSQERLGEIRREFEEFEEMRGHRPQWTLLPYISNLND